MFNPFSAPSPARANPFAHAYRQIDAETGVASASPHRLVAMLFDNLVDSIAQARGAMQAGRIEDKAHAVGRAVRIVEEGLRASLDPRAGELAERLNELYGYVAQRLTLANLRNDLAMLDECQGLVAPLRDAWVQIGANVPQHP